VSAKAFSPKTKALIEKTGMLDGVKRQKVGRKNGTTDSGGSKAAVLCPDYIIAPCRFNSVRGGEAEAKLQRRLESQQVGG
jgi:hypothetical protein